MIFLLSDTVRGVRVQYDPKDTNKKGYLFKSMDESLEEDDLVIIPTDSRHGMTVGKVMGFDDEIDLDMDMELKWILGRVDTQAADSIIEQEQTAITAADRAEKDKRRKELREALMEQTGGALEKLAITSG